jgi:hypothetical protein
MNDLFHRFTEPEDEVGGRGYRGQVNAEQLHRRDRRPIEGGQETAGALSAHILQGGVECHGHNELDSIASRPPHGKISPIFSIYVEDLP